MISSAAILVAISTLNRFGGDSACDFACDFACALRDFESQDWIAISNRQIIAIAIFRNGQSTVGGKWTKMDLFRPEWTKMDHFGPSWLREC